MSICLPRVATRALLFGVFFLIAFFVGSGRAHALDATPASATPADAPVQSPPPANTETLPPPETPTASPTPSTPAGAGGPDNTNDQSALVTTQGTGAANSGGNTATTTPASSTSAGAPDGPSSATAGAGSGTASSTGTDATTGITQQAAGEATPGATVDIVQIALTINVGNATATSGKNLAGGGSAAGAPGTVADTVKTGTASTVGDHAKTGITQSAVVTNGDASSQAVTVINIGIAVGNSGMNITIGTIGAGPVAGAGATATSATIGSGGATAIGDKARSKITQKASGTATGTAVLNIDQRAYILNFGIAIANTGGNFALSSLDASSLTPVEQAAVNALLAALAPLFGNSPTNATAAVTTGGARAVGTDATTTISQNAVGLVSGTSVASASQRAEVANFGLALSNTGLNGALSGAIGSDLATAQTSFDQFLSLLTNLDWLTGSNPFAQFSQTVNLGGLTLDLGGSLSGSDIFLGWDNAFAPDGGPIAGGVHVRQISAVLDIGFATSDSGDNVVLAIDQSNGGGSNVEIKHADTESGKAAIITGDVVAVGDGATVTVCQSFHDAAACAVKTTTRTPKPPTVSDPDPADPPAVTVDAARASIDPPAAPAAAVSAGESLPFTGGESRTLTELGLALVALGAVASRRRRRLR